MHYGGIERIVDMLARDSPSAAMRSPCSPIPDRPARCPKSPGAERRSALAARYDPQRGDAGRHVATGGIDIVHSFSRLAYLGADPALPLSRS